MIIASPIAASAAATVMTKNTKTCPFVDPKNDENDTNTRFTEFSINSMHMKTIIALRLISTPITPMVNKMRAKMRK
jgi:hypothetical protein